MLNSLYKLLSSVKLTIFVLLALAIGSIVGTLLPQGMTPQGVAAQFGDAAAHTIVFFGLHDLYHSSWFRFLILLLATNLIACTLQRIPKTFKLLKHETREIVPERLTRFSLHEIIVSGLPLAELCARTDTFVKSELGGGGLAGEGDQRSLLIEKGRWSRWMVYVMHLSVLVILVGCLLGSVFGYKGHMNVLEGDTENRVRVEGRDEVLTLPFQIRCDKFEIEHYDSGMIKEYRSELGVVENGKEVMKRSIVVNSPMSYGGIHFYQSSYGRVLNSARVEFTDMESGKSFQMNLPFGEPVLNEENNTVFRLADHQEDFHNFGPAVAIVAAKPGQEPEGSWVLVDHPGFHGNHIGNYGVKVLDMDTRYYTGLQVKNDPGTYLVYGGFLLLLVAMGLTFYSSHRRYWIWAGVEGGRSKVVMAGTTNKMSISFERDFQEKVGRLRERLGEK